MQNTWKAWLGAVAASSLLSIDAYGRSSQSLVLTGNVDTSCTLVVTGSGNNGFDIGVTETAKLVGTVEEICNDPNGYTVTMTTTNGTTSGLLKSANAKDEMIYDVKYGDSPTAVTITDKSAEVTTAVGPSVGSDGRGAVKNVKIAYRGSRYTLHATDYTDTLTFTIAAR